MPPMQIRCPSCDRVVPATDVSLGNQVARCRPCDEVFDFAKQLASAPGSVRTGSRYQDDDDEEGDDDDGYEDGDDEEESLPTRSRRPVPLPAGMQARNDGKRLTLRRRWRGWELLFLGFFTMIWDGFLAVWFTMSLASGLWPMALFGSIHLMVGLGLTYYCLLLAFESTVIEVDVGQLTVRHEPLPYKKAEVLPVGRLVQLYSKRVVTRGNKSTTTTFELHAVLDDGSHRKLLDGLPRSDQALWLEGEIERFLGIQDRDVAGELDRDVDRHDPPSLGEVVGMLSDAVRTGKPPDLR